MSITYAMGLRGPRCNGCEFARIKYELGEKVYVHRSGTWTTMYRRGEAPHEGQGEPFVDDNNEPIGFIVSFMSIEHSDECFKWKPPKRRVK